MARERTPTDDATAEERLSRLGAEWYAEVRRRHPEPEAARKRRTDEADGGGFLDWLFGDADAGDGGDGGD